MPPLKGTECRACYPTEPNPGDEPLKWAWEVVWVSVGTLPCMMCTWVKCGSADWSESPSWTPLKTELLQAVIAASLKSVLLPGSAWKSGHRFPSYQSELFHEYQIHFRKIRFNKTISVGEAAVLGERLKYGFALNSPFCQMIGMPQKYYCKHFKNKTQSSRLI